MQTLWHILITDAHVEGLNRKFLGLTFFERRLREAKLAGISNVTFVTTLSICAPKTNSKFCAPYEISTQAPQNSIEVPLNGILSVEKNPNVLCEIRSAEDLPKARAFCRNQIIQNSGAGWVAKNINKALSLPVSSILSNTFITPNMWTIFNMLVGMCTAFFISQHGYWNGLIGGLFLQTASIFDGVDGEIAKFRYETSKWGAVLDSIADNGTLVAFLGGIAYFQAHQPDSSGSAILLGAMILAFLLILRVWTFVNRNLDSNSLVTFDNKFLKHLPSSDKWVSLARSLKDYIKKDFYSAVFFLCCLLGHREWVLYLVLVGAMVSLIMIEVIVHRYHPSKLKVVNQ
ncbi:MAG: CDP-alcohol phosphatidyltransferase family protein [Bdellovibrionota bacterium]